MHIRQLEYFAAVADNLNFTKASKQFHISQSAITLQIKALEEEMGVRLFDRTNHKVELTPAGRTFLEDTRAILNRTTDAIERAKRADTVFTGKLCVGFIKGFEKTQLSDLISDFHIKYPNISFSFVRENVAELYDGLNDSSIDVAFNLQYSLDNLENMDYLILKKYPLYAVVPNSHPLSHRVSIKRSELKGYPLVDMKRNDTYYGENQTITSKFTEAGFIPKVAYTSNDTETTIMAVAAGFGYALLPGYVTDSLLVKDKLIPIPIEGEEDIMTITVTWRKDNHNPALERFLQDAVRPAIEMGY